MNSRRPVIPQFSRERRCFLRSTSVALALLPAASLAQPAWSGTTNQQNNRCGGKAHTYLCLHTAGVEPSSADRIIEIGAIRDDSGISNFFHSYVNPQESVTHDNLLTCGITPAFLSEQPKFGDIAIELARFIAGSRLVLLNPSTDLPPLLREFAAAGFQTGALKLAEVIDVVTLADRAGLTVETLPALCQQLGLVPDYCEGQIAFMDALALREVYWEIE